MHVGGNRAQDLQFTVVIEYTNRSDADVYVQDCGSGIGPPIYYLESSEGGDSAYNPIWGCTGSDGLRVTPGDSRVDTLRLAALWADREGAQLSGRMRIGYHVSLSPGGPSTAPRSLSISNDFEVLLP